MCESGNTFQNQRRDIVLLIDVSESMLINDPVGSGLTSKRVEAALNLINKLKSGGYNQYKVGAIIFSDENFIRMAQGQGLPLVSPLTDVSYTSELENFIRSMAGYATGNTNYLWALEEARKMMEGAVNPTIIFFSDGAPILGTSERDINGNVKNRVFCKNQTNGNEEMLESVMGQAVGMNDNAFQQGCNYFNNRDRTGSWYSVQPTATRIAYTKAEEQVRELIRQNWYLNMDVFSIFLRTSPEVFNDNVRRYGAQDPNQLSNEQLLRDMANKMGKFYNVDETARLSVAFDDIQVAITKDKIQNVTLKMNGRTIGGTVRDGLGFLFQNISFSPGNNEAIIMVRVAGIGDPIDVPLSVSYTIDPDPRKFNREFTCPGVDTGTYGSGDVTARDRYNIQGGSAGCGSIKSATTLDKYNGIWWLLLLIAFPALLWIFYRFSRVQKKNEIYSITSPLLLFSLLIFLLFTILFAWPIYAENGSGYDTAYASKDAGFGINVQTFVPAVDGKSTSVIDSGRLLSPGQLSASFYSHYVNRPLQISYKNGAKADRITENLFTTNYQLAYGIHQFVDFGISVPVSFYRDNLSMKDGFWQDKTKYAELGDIYLSGKVRLLPTFVRQDISLALNPFMTVPVANEGSLLGDAKLSFGFKVVAEKRFLDGWVVTTGLGGKFRPSYIWIYDDRAEDMVSVRHQFLYEIGVLSAGQIKKDLDFGIALKGSASSVNGMVGNDAASPMEVYLSSDYQILRNWRISGGVGTGLGIGIGSPRFRVFAGIKFDFAVLQSLGLSKKQGSSNLYRGIDDGIDASGSSDGVRDNNNSSSNNNSSPLYRDRLLESDTTSVDPAPSAEDDEPSEDSPLKSDLSDINPSKGEWLEVRP